MSTAEDQIKKMYEASLTNQKEQLGQDYAQANSELDVQQQKNQVATDQNLTRTAVEAQKAAVNNAELHNAAGLSSGARAQARLAQENQLQANMTALRAAQQQSDAEIERQRGLLAQEFQSAIRQAQADNDLALAEALYEQAQKDDADLLSKQKSAAELMAKAGDFSLYQQLYGLTDEQVAALTKSVNGGSEGYTDNQLYSAQLLAETTGDYTELGRLLGWTDAQIWAANGVDYDKIKPVQSKTVDQIIYETQWTPQSVKDGLCTAEEMYAALDYVMEKYNLSLGEYKYLAEFYGLEGW